MSTNGRLTLVLRGTCWQARLVIALVFISLTGCGRRDAHWKYERPSDVRDFTQLFTQNCSGCHGADGQWGPAPPLADPLFLAIIPEAEFTRVVSQGRPSTLMPAFAREQGGELTDEQIAILVRGIRAKWGSTEGAAPEPLPDYLAPPAAGDTKTPENSAAALAIFATVCGNCHGEHGQGGEKAGALRDTAFLALISDQALRRIVITGRQDLGMPDFRRLGAMLPAGQPLTNQQIAELATLLASWRHPNQLNDQDPSPAAAP